MISDILSFILHIDQHLSTLASEYGVWIYVFLFPIIFCETGLVITPFLPGDSLLFAAGALTAVPNSELNINIMVIVLLSAAILGDAVNFMIGKYFGTKLFSNPNSKIFKQRYLDKTHQFYEKHGSKTIIIARFVPIVRTFAPFVAGMGKMNYRKFFHYNIIGAMLWVLSITYLGYAFGNLSIIKKNFGLIAIIMIILSIIPILIQIIRTKLKK